MLKAMITVIDDTKEILANQENFKIRLSALEKKSGNSVATAAPTHFDLPLPSMEQMEEFVLYLKGDPTAREQLVMLLLLYIIRSL